jgi:hypothetical protein
VLWVRSHSIRDSVRRSVGEDSVYRLASYRGTVFLQCSSLVPGSVIASFFETVQWDAERVEPEFGDPDAGDSMDSVAWRKAGPLGFGYSARPFFEGTDYTLVVPHWFLAALAASPGVAFAAGAVRRRVRRRRRLCPRCGYDLRASPQRCPECGEEAETVSPAR